MQRPLTVQLSQQVWFSFLNQSAGKLVFDSSKAQGSLVIDYPDDKIIRSDKSIKLLMAAMDSHAGKFKFKLGSTLIDTLSIKATDNDREHAVITLSPVKYSMREGTSDQLKMQLPADYSFEDNVNLDYTWSGMGITTDQRIVNQSGNVTFSKNQNALYFPVNVLDNKVVDRYNQRTVAFKVSGTIATPVTITPQDYSEVTIIDDDMTSLHIPNTFTPNNDGINDTWNITNLAFDSHSKVTIFNRLGAVDYFSNGYAVPWNGRAGNSDIPVGTYYYIISFYNKTFSENVTVIR